MKRIGAVLVAICATAGAADTPTLTPEQMREDLIHLRDVWAPLDKSFSEEERAAFVAIVNDAISHVNTLTPTDFSLEIARAVAVSRNGHTESSLGPWFHGLPFKAAWFTDGMYIVRVHPRFPQLLGARIERFGAFTPEQAVTRLAPYVAGTDEWIHYLSSTYLRFAEVLHRIGAAATATKVSLTVRRRDGKKETTVLTQDAWSTDPDPGNPWLALVPTDKEVPGRWLQVLDDVSARPLMYQRPTDVSWHWIGNGNRVLYVRSTQIYGLGDDHYGLMEKLVGLLQEEVVPRQPRHVIVDLRLNSGGDLTNTITFAQALPRLIASDGRIFVLVGPRTFSAALVTAAMLKAYGGDRVVLAGEKMGDRDPFWAEGRPHPLPNSKITVTPAGWMHNWSVGCEDLDPCYWANVIFGPKNISLEPQIRVAPSFAEYAAGRDPLLEAVLKLTE